MQGALSLGDDMDFQRAVELGDHVGIDPWAELWRRVESKPGVDGPWFLLMQHATVDRIDDLVDLARRKMPWSKIVSGPADELGLGPGFQYAAPLEFVLQGLVRFPGRGRDLLLAGLRCPVVRVRNCALRVLAEWPPAMRNNEVLVALRGAVELEPNPDVRVRIQALIHNQPMP